MFIDLPLRFLPLLRERKGKSMERLVKTEEHYPLCVSVNGMMGREATRFVQHLVDQLSRKWDSNYSSLVNKNFFCHHPCNNTMSQRITYKMAVSGHDGRIFFESDNAGITF